ncbi:hypothetical protein Cs7R123_49840 [Catellatospora sp. TT07R-123]|uniref:DUF4132 domain-containing protein n=1 Tax=Catellatospora sp. TT07R-123 TaxID=2733863 RepID=UPI001B24CB3C|nr:DUF4132 domain-containing protein [Catellatospora sp. TT07R-123]GHJ47642.1 hypothetical protein Cs7R123_49840 [Catellatospora sp. TT07R-123]
MQAYARNAPVNPLAMMALVHQARKAADAADHDALRAVARDMLHLLGDPGVARRLANADEAELDRLYDAAFPLTDPADLADVLDAPWPTTARVQAVLGLLRLRDPGELQLDPLVDAAATAGDRRLLRAIALTPFGRTDRPSRAMLLEALHTSGGLDDEVVAHLAEDMDLVHHLFGYYAPAVAAAVSDRFRPAWEEHLWQLTSAPDVDYDRVVSMPEPRGLRFVLRALDYTGNWRVVRYLGAAELTPAERAELVEHLRGAPPQRQEQAFTLRLAAGDAQVLLPLLGLAGADRLLRLIQTGQATSRVVRNDRAAILAAAAEAGAADLARLLKLAPNDVVAAALGLRRDAVMARVAKDSPVGITAYGMLPLSDGETVLDRWVALRELHRHGMELPATDRRRQHANAVSVALDHLAQLGGYADAAALDAAGEAYSPTPVAPVLTAGPYTAVVGFDGVEPAIIAAKGARVLKSVPKAVRDEPGVAALREQHELLRGHTARLSRMLRRLVTTGVPLPPAELARLRATPAGAALLPLLVWQDAGGRFGLLDELDGAGAVTAAHPAALAAAGQLASRQAEAARRRLCQPVPQLFREWYAPTPQEVAGQSTRFTGRVIAGAAVVRELSTRGWSLHDAPLPYAVRQIGAHSAVLHGTTTGYWGAGDVSFDRLEFRAGDGTVAADGVPPVVFSEAVRDLDLAAWAGRRSVGDYATGRARARAELLTAVLAERATDRISWDGDTVVIRGSLAVYRVHLGTEVVLIGDGIRPADVPHSLGDESHPALFRTVESVDYRMMRLLGRVLALAEDEKIDSWTLGRMGLGAEPS